MYRLWSLWDCGREFPSSGAVGHVKGLKVLVWVTEIEIRMEINLLARVFIKKQWKFVFVHTNNNRYRLKRYKDTEHNSASKLLKISLETQVWLIIYHLILYFQHYNWYHKKACSIVFTMISHLLWLCNYGMYSTAGYEWRSEMKSCNSLVLPSRETPIVFILQWVWTIASTQCFARFHFWLSIKTSCSVLSMIS